MPSSATRVGEQPDAASAAAARSLAAAISVATSSSATTPIFARSSAGEGPAGGSRIASNTAAQSTTDRARTPTWSSEAERGMSPADAIASRVGLKPTQPQYEAGMRTEPSVSLPIAAAAIPAATPGGVAPTEHPGVQAEPYDFH